MEKRFQQNDDLMKDVAGAIERARRNRVDRERQAAAQRQLAQDRAEAEIEGEHERAKRREVAEAVSELRTFYGHIMSSAELDRAQQLKEEVPSLASRIDELQMDQSRLMKEADQQRKLAEQREETARRIKAEQAKRELDDKRAEQEAEIEAEHKQEAFAKALPGSCKEARQSEKDLESSTATSDLVRATSLAEAGDIKAACTSFNDFASKLEIVRAQLVQCTKDLDTNLDALARQEATAAISKATEIYTTQKVLRQKRVEMSCE